MEGTTFWPAPALAGDHDRILDHLEQSTPVRLIATFHDLTVALADDPVAAAAARADQGRFEFLPVRESPGGPIVGLFVRGKSRIEGEAGTVQGAMEPLSGANLIGADAPLLDFVHTADDTPCRLVLDRSEIRGLVTLSDLQRLPVRTVLFGRFIHLEMLLTEVLRGMLPDGEMPFDRLSLARASKGRERWEEMRTAGMERDPFEAISFGDKKTIAKKAKIFSLSGERIDRELQAIEENLRDPIAHGHTLAATEADARKLARAARLMRDWIELCRASVARPAHPRRQEEGRADVPATS